ncbi:hypothetical protein [Flavobacterium sp. M31R6]|nr:hypothetical protein [Flavobacterium sp. M31R6]
MRFVIETDATFCSGDWILKNIKLERPLVLFIGANATFCSGAT